MFFTRNPSIEELADLRFMMIAEKKITGQTTEPPRASSQMMCLGSRTPTPENAQTITSGLGILRRPSSMVDLPTFGHGKCRKLKVPN